MRVSIDRRSSRQDVVKKFVAMPRGNLASILDGFQMDRASGILFRDAGPEIRAGDSSVSNSYLEASISA
jgi:hypothetical protein